MEKLKLAYSLLRSKAYILLTDKTAVISIAMMDIDKFESVIMLSSQTAALLSFREKLDEVIKEHEAAVKSMQARKGSNLFGNGKVEVSKGKK